MIVEQIKELSKNESNDQKLGRNVRRLTKELSVFDEVSKYLNENFKGYSMMFNSYPFSIRFDYWVRVSNELENYLFDRGFELDIYYDEDCGVLYRYVLKPNAK